MKKFKLSEEQDRMIQEMLNEAGGLTITPDINKSGNIGADVKNAIAAVKEKGGSGLLKDGANVGITTSIGSEQVAVSVNPIKSDEVNSSETTSIYESVLITKNQLLEAKLKRMKSNSKVIKVKNFMK